jgi:uncharacterized protein YeaO (DUF488 family)
MNIHTKRVYDPPDPNDGTRILVDRLWPRGLSKEKVKIQYWAKEVAPSTELRLWYGHDPEKWSEFKSRYFEELNSKPGGVEELLGYIKKGKVTFVYSAKEQRLNNAVALREYLSSFT